MTDMLVLVASAAFLSGSFTQTADAVPARAAEALRREWVRGVEREVDAGHYFSLYGEVVGWRVWRGETRDGIRCRAILPADGNPQPFPAGTLDAFTGPTPYLELKRSRVLDRYHYTWAGTNTREAWAQWRQPGDRFWADGEFDPLVITSLKLEAEVVSWEYPALRVGRAAEVAAFSLQGFAEAALLTQRCDAGLLPAD